MVVRGFQWLSCRVFNTMVITVGGFNGYQGFSMHGYQLLAFQVALYVKNCVYN